MNDKTTWLCYRPLNGHIKIKSEVKNMKVYSRRRKNALLEMLEMLLEKGDILYLDNVKSVVAIDEVANKKYMVVDDCNIIPYERFFESYKNSEFLTDLFTDVTVKSSSDNIAAFFEKFFN